MHRPLPSFLPIGLPAIAIALTGCSSSTGPDSAPEAALITELPRELTASEVEILRATNEFGFDLLRQVHASDPSENSFLSPLSASMALGMALNGSAEETFDAMRLTLGFQKMELDDINASYRSLIDLLQSLDPNVKFQIGNSVWYRHGWTPEADYLERVTGVFDAQVAGLDFSIPTAADVMNDWVREATNGRIEDIVVPPIDPLTVAFLINAMDFEGLWTGEFDPNETRDAVFHNQDGTTGTVRLMARDGIVSFASGSGYEAIDLPYGGEAFSMTIVLPGQGRTVGDLVDDLDATEWGALTSSFASRDIEIRIPRFRMEWESSLNDVLKALGMAVAFDPNEADFTRMFADALENQIHISNVKQKTFVEVDEAGTRASAATSVEVGTTSFTPPFTVDRPFLFAIRERFSGTVLFLGAVVQAPS